MGLMAWRSQNTGECGHIIPDSPAQQLRLWRDISEAPFMRFTTFRPRRFFIICNDCEVKIEFIAEFR